MIDYSIRSEGCQKIFPKGQRLTGRTHACMIYYENFIAKRQFEIRYFKWAEGFYQTRSEELWKKEWRQRKQARQRDFFFKALKQAYLLEWDILPYPLPWALQPDRQA